MLRGVDGSGNDASRNRCYTIKVETGVTFLCLSLPPPSPRPSAPLLLVFPPRFAVTSTG